MFTMVVVAILSGGTPVQPVPPSLQTTVSVEIYGADGKPRSGFSVRPPPTTRALTPVHFFRFPQDARTPRGAVVRALGFTAWLDGADVRVQVVTLSPKSPTQPRTDRILIEDYDLAELASFVLAVGASRTLLEMKDLGLGPMSVRVFPPGKHAH